MRTERPRVRARRFGPLSIAYDQRLLEPRPWTALQSRWAADLLDVVPPGPVLELCSGAGHIGLLAVHASDRSLVCVDVDPAACQYARENAAAAGMAARVEVRNDDLTSFADERSFPLVIADPPWVRTPDVGRFPDDPVRAIDGGADGLELARACVEVVDRQLHPAGVALLQVGSPAQVRELADGLPAGLVLGEMRSELGRGTVAQLVRPR